MDRFTAMGAFVRVVEAGSFTRAADTLGLPRANLTRLVQGLERDLRVRLLERTTRAVKVTHEGAAYYERAVALLAEVADMEATARQSAQQPSGELRIDVATAMAAHLIVPALPALYRAYPQLRLHIGSSNQPVNLVADNVDCALRIGRIEDQDLIARRVGEFRMVTCASPAYLSAHGTPATPHELQAQHELVALAMARSGKALDFRFARRGEPLDLTPRGRFMVDDTNSYLVAAAMGLGVAQVPSYVLGTALAAGTLVPILEDWQAPPVPVSALYRRNRFLGAKVSVFVDWASGLFARLNA
ncbi:LysR family transcriptional regulator [Ramlibacter albus]|uniref:LysR family transcriptional regulator n=1 Tax=Ramlibacter albus TaxID=2079448 RepID=A0A923MAY3_9BURK|nr:LysR family transcriptional regulator [Ramlibacter albus]MBC5765737.1 LysR family transcriptional regulator [Ramlibacter albus]